MICYKAVSKTFGRVTALDNVNVEMETGKSYALIGPNGSGKTTLIKCLLGLVIPTGKITFAQKNILGDWKYREQIGYMPQIGRYPNNMTIGQLIDMMKNIRQRTGELDEQLIGSLKLNKVLEKRMYSLSGGTRQKVSAALAFLFDPPVLILDEPTAGLDVLSVEILKEKILLEKKRGKLIIISSHILSDLDDLATNVLYLQEGQIHYNGTIDALKQETNETRLGKAMATLIRQKELLDSLVE